MPTTKPAKKIVFDNEEVIMTDSTRPDWSYAFSPSEFSDEYDGMTIEQYNADRTKSGSPFRVELKTWSTTIERY